MDHPKGGMMMSTFDDTLSELEMQKAEMMQRLNAITQDEGKVKAKIRQIKQRTERRRVHKMIVLGSALWSEFIRLTGMTEDAATEFLNRPDDETAKFARKAMRNCIDYVLETENSENV